MTSADYSEFSKIKREYALEMGLSNDEFTPIGIKDFIKWGVENNIFKKGETLNRSLREVRKKRAEQAINVMDLS